MEEGEVHIFRGTNRDEGVYPFPCPCCNSLTYLGKFIPTVSWFSADYLGTIFQCHNPNCDPIYEKHTIDWDRKGEPCEPRTFYELIDFGAYWDSEDDCYYTPQAPRE
jgi:hypothetical protein